MARKTIDDSILHDIGDAIRTKLSVLTTYKPAQMAAAILSIVTANLETLNAIANGTYTPSSGKNGFSQVNVNVPNTYAAEDEGKVVSNGALVAQTARSTEIDQNGTYDTTNNNSVTVNVSGGGPSGELTPDYAGLSYGYIATTGVFYSNTSNTAYVSLFEVEQGHTYLFCVKSTVSNRLRAQLFYGKTVSDFYPYLTESMANTQVFTADRNITGRAELVDDELYERFIAKPGSDGVLFITTSNESIEAPVHVYEYPYSLPANTLQWETGSDSDIVNALAAAHAGTLDLQTDLGWEVGDVRTISISAFTAGGNVSEPAQNIDIVITSFEDYNNCGCVLQFDFLQAQNLYAQPAQIPAPNPPAPALQPTQMSGANQPQGLSLPTRYAEIVQVEDEGIIDRFQVGAGQSQMFMNRTETLIAIKTAYQDGTGYSVDYYDKRPPAPPAPVFDPREYVRIDELESRMEAFLAAQAAQSAQNAPKRAAVKKEDA